MEACLLVTKTNKEKKKKGNVLFINAVKEVKQEKSISYLEDKHILKIFNTYKDYKEIEGFSKILSYKEILSNRASLNIALYISNVEKKEDNRNVSQTYKEWGARSLELNESMKELFSILGKKS